MKRGKRKSGKKSKDKKGLLLLEALIRLLIAIIVIGLIIYAGVLLFHTYIGKPKEMRAKGTLEQIYKTLNEANETGITQKLVIYNPLGWVITAFDSEHNENQGLKKPGIMYGKNCICICEKGVFRKVCKSEICREIKMPLKQEGKDAFIEIEIKDLYFTHMKDYWSVDEKAISIVELTDEEKQEYAVLKIKTKQDYGSIIEAKAKKHYREVSKYFDNATDFNNYILAIIIVESSGKADAKSPCGAIGLMQLMPDTAREQGLNVPNYREICNKGKPELGPCPEPYDICYNAFECNKIEPEKCNETEDERFDPEKNIEAGTIYIINLINQFKDRQLALVAYNAGPANLQENCKALKNIFSCPSDFSGRIYSEKVMSHYQLKG